MFIFDIEEKIDRLFDEVFPPSPFGDPRLNKRGYGYYVFLRIVVCFGAVVFAALSSGHKRDNLWLLFAFIGVLYNPFIPFHLSRDIWLLLNAATIAAFSYGLFFWLAAVRKSRTRPNN